MGNCASAASAKLENSTDWVWGSGFTLPLRWPMCRQLSEELILRSPLPSPVATTVQPWAKPGRRSGWKLGFSFLFLLPQKFSFHLCLCLWSGLADTHVHEHQYCTGARTGKRAGLPQVQQPSLSSDESISVTVTWAPERLSRDRAAFSNWWLPKAKERGSALPYEILLTLLFFLTETEAVSSGWSCFFLVEKVQCV